MLILRKIMYSKRMNDSGKKVGEHALDYHETIQKI